MVLQKYTSYILSTCLFIVWADYVICKDCDLGSNDQRCGHRQICIDGVCHSVVTCKSQEDCSESGTECVLNFCQPDNCTRTGQCAYGFVCSQFGKCLWFHDEKAEEHKTFVLKILGPAPKYRNYKNIRWVKLTEKTSSMIVFYDEVSDESYKITYYNDYCDDGEKCSVSGKSEINTKTGELTIYNVTYDDEGYYYYTFMADENITDTGEEYEQHLEVFVVPKDEDVSISRSPEGPIEPGMEVTFTCTVRRIKPPANYIRWEFTHENPCFGQNKTEPNADKYTFGQTSVFTSRFTKHDDRKRVKCRVKPFYARPITKIEIINLDRSARPTQETTPVPAVLTSQQTTEPFISTELNPTKPSVVKSTDQNKGYSPTEAFGFVVLGAILTLTIGAIIYLLYRCKIKK